MHIVVGILAVAVVSLVSYIFIQNKKLKILKISVDAFADTSFDLTGSSEQVAAVSKDLQSASIEQLDSLTATISASHEINMMVNKTSDNAVSLVTEASALKKVSEEGTKIIGVMVTVSEEIREGNVHFKNEILQIMEELNQNLSLIQEIANKTKLINDIVFQTKLLSFNASVEAARAGIHGKGFAVVAEEIGKLALMSGKGADEITNIVDKSVVSISNSIDKARTRVENLTSAGQKKNDLGFQSTKNCEALFYDISNKINSINLMIEEITVAAKEQSIGVNQLDLAIVSLQEVADRNRLVACQSTEHAIEFELQSKKINEINQHISEEFNFSTYKHPRLQKFVWNDKLELGVHQMDEEHKILIQKINTLVEALEAQYTKKNKPVLLSSFNDFADYTAIHFAEEEMFMQSINYAQYSSHKRIHEKLLEQVGAYGKLILNDQLDDKKLVSFLRNWLMSHIMGVDMQYANFSREPKKKKIA